MHVSDRGSQQTVNSNGSGRSVPKSISLVLKGEPKEVDTGVITRKFYLDEFERWTDNERERNLEFLSALDLLRTIEQVHNDLATIKLENHILVDYLEKNDPKLLIGMTERRLSIMKRAKRERPSEAHSIAYSARQSSSRRSMSMSIAMSNHTGMTTSVISAFQGGERRRFTDFKLNNKAKAELAEKAAAEVEKRVADIEHNAMVEVKQLRAKIEELRFRSEETIETEKNFILHFLRDENDLIFLEKATERQLERKLRKFTANWFKNARALLGTMRLTIISLQESCQQNRADLVTKADLSGILTAVDFEQLIIKRTELLNELEEKNTHMAGLKGITGKTSLAMSEEKQAMMNLEDEMRSVLSKIDEVSRAVGRLEKDVKAVNEINEKDRLVLEQLRKQLDEYEAPSITEYIERKEEAHLLDKEERMLQRKISILNMKLANVRRAKNRLSAT